MGHAKAVTDSSAVRPYEWRIYVVGARVTRKQLVFPSGLQSTSVVRGPRYLRFLCQGRDSLWVSKFNVQGSWYG